MKLTTQDDSRVRELLQKSGASAVNLHKAGIDNYAQYKFDNYDKFKKFALDNQCVRKQALIGEIGLTTDMRKIEYGGLQLPLGDTAVYDLARILGIPLNISKKFTKLLGPEIRANLLNMIRAALATSKKGKRLTTLIVDPATQKVERIVPPGTGVLSYDSFFDLFERIGDYGNLKLNNMSFCRASGVRISAVVEKGEFQIGNHKDELFHPGITLGNSLTDGTDLNHFIYRLVCSNGMIGIRSEQLCNLKSLSEKSLEEFYGVVEHLAANNFMPGGFENVVQKAMRTNASFAELKTIANSIKGHSNLEIHDIDRWLPYQETMNRFHAKGIDIGKLSPRQQECAATPIKVWDAVNMLTDFASHEFEGVEIKDDGRSAMQMAAGALLGKKEFDTECLVAAGLFN